MNPVWYNNSALVGLIGVFLGAVLSFLGTMYSEYAKMKTLKMEQEFREQEKAKEKRELAHQHSPTISSTRTCFGRRSQGALSRLSITCLAVPRNWSS